jgi:hypothetical protein
MTSTSAAPGTPNTRSASTIEDDINNSFHCEANERRCARTGTAIQNQPAAG